MEWPEFMVCLQRTNCFLCASHASHVIRWKRAIVFRHGCLTGIIKVERRGSLSSGQGCECFTRVHLARRRNWFDACRATHVSPAVGAASGNWIVELVDRASMERDA